MNRVQMLLSIINMKLRDVYEDLESFCEDYNIEANIIIEKMARINYVYNIENNQFINKEVLGEIYEKSSNLYCRCFYRSVVFR